MYELLNRDRMNPANAAEAGRRAQPLRWNEKLAAIARAHSRDMIRRGYFDHVDPDGRSPGDRMRAAGIDWRESGENIAIGPTVAQAEASLMNEPRFQQNHRWNILNSKYTEVGIGIARGPGGEYYITQDFIESAAVR
ncbi:MAG TPA: CAP domain-containing protein [Candidatus Acidoferrales bacterium]|nr:CAP domain-containing protein [Candidatus Acidoferrales bacterium]